MYFFALNSYFEMQYPVTHDINTPKKAANPVYHTLLKIISKNVVPSSSSNSANASA